MLTKTVTNFVANRLKVYGVDVRCRIQADKIQSDQTRSKGHSSKPHAVWTTYKRASNTYMYGYIERDQSCQLLIIWFPHFVRLSNEQICIFKFDCIWSVSVRFAISKR